MTLTTFLLKYYKKLNKSVCTRLNNFLKGTHIK